MNFGEMQWRYELYGFQIARCPKMDSLKEAVF